MAHKSLETAREVPRFRRVLMWLLVPMTLATILYIAAGRLPSLEYQSDSASYLELVERGVFTKESLESTRTLGYPIFLGAVERVCGSLAPVPLLHWAMFCAAIIFLAYSLFRLGGSIPLCVALTSPLYFSDVAAGYLPVLLTEVPAMALAVTAVASLVLAVHEPTHRRWWAALTVAVFLSYQVRPAFLCLIVIIPLLGLLIYPAVHDSVSPQSKRWKVVFKATAAVSLPLFGFCLMRFVLVGHFGLVSFGGYNLVGITGSFLEEGMLPHLSPGVRPLAARMLEIRSTSELEALQREKQASWDQALVRRAGIVIPRYEVIERLYNSTIRFVAMPAASELYGEDSVATDQAFSQLSREVIALRPITYAAWVGIALYKGIMTALTLYLMVALWLLMAGIFLLGRVLELTARGRKGTESGCFTLLEHEGRVFNVVATTAIIFFCAKSLLVAAVEPTIPRYVRPAAIFLSTIPAMVIYCQVRHWFSTTTSQSFQQPGEGALECGRTVDIASAA